MSDNNQIADNAKKEHILLIHLYSKLKSLYNKIKIVMTNHLQILMIQKWKTSNVDNVKTDLFDHVV